MFPDWEPVPYTLTGEPADIQERGFFERAQKLIRWEPVPWQKFPPDGVFGRDREWFSTIDAEFIASQDGEDLVLIQNACHGFPDPPEWGLASKPTQRVVAWTHWGHFPNLPDAWIVPKNGRRSKGNG